MIRNSELKVVEGMNHAMMIRIPNRTSKTVHDFIK